MQQNKPPEEPAKPRGQISLRLNGVVKSFFPLRPREDPAASDTISGKDAENSEDEDADEGSDGDLRKQVSNMIDRNEQDSEDGPDYMFDKDETTSPDPDYIFCPAPHRKQILHLFTKHFCQHPIFPERRDESMTTKEIRRAAVFEMYEFCGKRGLREVWGYLWACWYSPKMWRLWARSTSTYLSRLRTTMSVENFWRQLKHNYLHNVARPRLDHLVWILIYKVTPSYFARTQILDDTHRLGRSKPLTTYQRAFKKSWITLMKKDTSNTTYTTDVSKWTCNCGQQKYQCHHLCKHLVQAVGIPEDKRFFRNIVRRRVVPIYRHPLLVLKGSEPGEYIEPDGSTTDGDDNQWSGSKEVLEGSHGGWKDLVEYPAATKQTSTSQVRKRQQPDNLEAEEVQVNKSPKRARLSEVIDLTMSSPIASDHQDLPVSDIWEMEIERSSSSTGYGSGDEIEVSRTFKFRSIENKLNSLELDEISESLAKKSEALKKAAALIDAQLPYRNPIWMKSVDKLKFGNDVMDFVADIEREEKRGRNRDTTWAEGRGKKAKRRVKNTMGYMSHTV